MKTLVLNGSKPSAGRLLLFVAWAVFVLGGLSGCKPLYFSQSSLDSTETFKKSALSLMLKATEDYSTHEKAVDALNAQAQTIVQSEAARGKKNISTVEMWNTMLDPQSNLLGGFMSLWKSKGKLSSGFVSEAQNQVSRNFDRIMDVEKQRKRQ